MHWPHIHCYHTLSGTERKIRRKTRCRHSKHNPDEYRDQMNNFNCYSVQRCCICGKLRFYKDSYGCYSSIEGFMEYNPKESKRAIIALALADGEAKEID